MDKKLDASIENYLRAVVRELRGLRAEQRASELHEMRQHLETNIARLIEEGSDEDAAVAATLAQFGPPRQVGRALRAAKRERVPLWRIVAAPLCALACHGAFYLAALLLCDVLFGFLFGPDWNSWRGFGWFSTDKPLDFFFTTIYVALGPFAAGILSARVGGRTAVWSVGIVYGLLCVLPLGINNEHFGNTILWVCLGAFIEGYGSKRRKRVKHA